jgi:pantoate--beta-alanine ligase
VKIIRSIPPLRNWVRQARRANRKIAFVPTMGALHVGHLSLIHRARKEAGRKGLVVVSIFVNPTQFNQKSDLAKYPKRLTKDARMCQRAGADLIFAPSAHTMYAKDFSTWVEEQSIALPLCGETRPGHFRGVCTVVLKLFNLVQPDLAIFGQKDAQQALVLRRMVRDLNLPIRMITAPIVREQDGLAMSSRNERLTPSERMAAPRIYEALKHAQKSFRPGLSRASFIQSVRRELTKIPGVKIDYIELVNPETLEPVRRASRGDLLAVAVFLGKVRLIDNVRL